MYLLCILFINNKNDTRTGTKNVINDILKLALIYKENITRGCFHFPGQMTLQYGLYSRCNPVQTLLELFLDDRFLFRKSKNLILFHFRSNPLILLQVQCKLPSPPPFFPESELHVCRPIYVVIVNVFPGDPFKKSQMVHSLLNLVNYKLKSIFDCSHIQIKVELKI